MTWVLRALFVTSLLLMQLWVLEARSLSPLAGTVRALGVLLLGITFAIWMIRTWRSKAYLMWSAPARWSYLSLAIALAVFGGAGWAITYAGNVGWPTTVWYIGAPFIYGLLNFRQLGAPR